MWLVIYKKKLKKHKTNFIPVDSEHFSILDLIKKEKKSNIKKIFITASGGPFLNQKKKKILKNKSKNAINTQHGKWVKKFQ